MIRKTIHVLLIMIGFIILTSKSCCPDTEIDKEAILKAEQDTTLMEIKSEFASEYLFEDKLIVYGEKAKQKLLDFADCLCLFSDKNLDTLLKQQVKDMTYRLFFNKDAIIQLGIDMHDKDGHGKKTLASLLAELEGSDYRSVEFGIFDLRTIEPLHFERADRYAGKLGCRFKITGITENDSLLLSETINQVKMIVTRTSKQFGADTSWLVWQVFLDEIEVGD